MKKNINIVLCLGVLVCMVVFVGLDLAVSKVGAVSTGGDKLILHIESSCTIGLDESSTLHAVSMNNSETKDTEMGFSRINAFCNDADGYSIYAIGYTGDEYNNKMTGVGLSSSFDIATGIGGDSSWWAMKLQGGNGTDSPEIVSDYVDYFTVPSNFARVAYRNSGTDMVNPDEAYFDAMYRVHISSSQPAGTYNGQVKYVMVHPVDAVAPSSVGTIDDIVYMQDFAALSAADKNNVLNSMGVNVVYTKKDRRDMQEYTIVKLANNDVWMTKNLNIAGGTIIESTLSDVDNTYTVPSDDGWQAGGKLPESAIGLFYQDGYAYVYNSNNTLCEEYAPCYSYYSWDAATAGSDRITSAGEDAPYSICPKGWKLPKSNSNSKTSFRTLLNNITAYGWEWFDGLVSAPYNFALAGLHYNGGFYRGGDAGYYWSSKASGSMIDYAVSLYIDSDYVTNSNTGRYRDGRSVRCVVRQ